MALLSETYTIPVEGMSCGHCESKVSQAIRQVPGVQGVKASAKAGEVQVTVSKQSPPDRKAVEAAITASGYLLRP